MTKRQWEIMTVSTLEDEQIVWTDKSSQTDKSSDVKTGRTNFQTTLSSEFVRLFVRLWRRFFEDDLSVQTNKSTIVRPKFTLRRTLTEKWPICPSWGKGTSKRSHGLWEICLEISGVGRLEFTLVEQTVR